MTDLSAYFERSESARGSSQYALDRIQARQIATSRKIKKQLGSIADAFAEAGKIIDDRKATK